MTIKTIWLWKPNNQRLWERGCSAALLKGSTSSHGVGEPPKLVTSSTFSATGKRVQILKDVSNQRSLWSPAFNDRKTSAFAESVKNTIAFIISSSNHLPSYSSFNTWIAWLVNNCWLFLWAFTNNCWQSSQDTLFIFSCAPRLSMLADSMWPPVIWRLVSDGGSASSSGEAARLQLCVEISPRSSLCLLPTNWWTPRALLPVAMVLQKRFSRRSLFKRGVNRRLFASGCD